MNSSRLELVYFPPKQFSARFGDNFFSANIENFERVKPIDSCSSKYVVFVIIVSRGRSAWAVKRRFTDFEKLLVYMKEKFPRTVQPFPALPPKTYLSVVNDDSFLEARLKELQTFLNEMLTTLHMEKILLDDKVTEFLELYNFNSRAESI
jgi:hypothetical protein